MKCRVCGEEINSGGFYGEINNGVQHEACNALEKTGVEIKTYDNSEMIRRAIDSVLIEAIKLHINSKTFKAEINLTGITDDEWPDIFALIRKAG